MTAVRTNWRRTLALVISIGFRAAPLLMTLVLGLAIFTSVAVFALPVSYKLFTDAFFSHDGQAIAVAAVLVGSISALRWMGLCLGASYSGKLAERTDFYMTQRIAELVNGVEGIEHFERPDYLQELELLEQNRAILANAPRHTLSVLQMFIQLFGIAAVLGSISPVLATVPVLGLAPFFAERRSVAIRQRAEERVAERRRLCNLLFELTSTAAPAKELRVFGLAPELARRHEEAAREVIAELDRAAVWRGLLGASGWFVFAVGMFGGIGLVMLKAADGTATPGQLLMAATLAQQIRFQLAQFAEATGQLLTTTRTAKRFLWLEDYAAEQVGQSTADIAVPRRIECGIALDAVSFTYPGTDVEVLHDVTITVPAGSSVAIVGENGAGKTTLIKLLTRLYRPTSGTIEVDGADITRFDLGAWRSRIASTFQDFVRFELRAGESVGIGDLERLDDVGAIDAALARAGGTDVITQLQDGYLTPLGRSFAGGRELSGGQWQKLALGRGMMRDEPLLVVLDEPTASLDAQTEHTLFERYAHASKRTALDSGAVTVFVSHRFSTVRMADIIVVLDGGTIIEQGSHAQLMAAGGHYAELFSLQARAYR